MTFLILPTIYKEIKDLISSFKHSNNLNTSLFSSCWKVIRISMLYAWFIFLFTFYTRPPSVENFIDLLSLKRKKKHNNQEK